MAKHVVTGAFGYSGGFIAEKLLERGHEVHTLTNSPNREKRFAGRVRAWPMCFDEPAKLTEALRGADVLYNTYWVRFNHRNFTHAQAVENTIKLFAAARAAGVSRVVHVSIANPSEQSDLEYYRCKARLERELIGTGMSYCILRPTVLFGGRDILINNIAWSLRHLPVFGIFGDGKYRIQPIHVADLAALAVEAGNRHDNEIIDAAGPEIFTFRELIETICRIIGKRRLLMRVTPGMGYLATKMLGFLMRDVFLTRDEIKGLMRGLLVVDSPPAGTTRLTDWAARHADTLGRRYASELARRRK
jgi:NADH dehydrogenase